MHVVKWLLCSIAVAATVSGLSTTAIASDPAERTIKWLSQEPVTLMDLGMMRLRDDLREASGSLVDLGYTNITPKVGTYYEWRAGKILAYVSLREPFSTPSEKSCLEVYDRVLQHVKSKAPGGAGSIGWYLESLFVHEGPGNWGRPKQMQEGLLNAIQFEVIILPPDPMRDSRKVQCSGRMDAELEDIFVTTS